MVFLCVPQPYICNKSFGLGNFPVTEKTGFQIPTACQVAWLLKLLTQFSIFTIGN